jgi:hypothetical protein
LFFSPIVSLHSASYSNNFEVYLFLSVTFLFTQLFYNKFHCLIKTLPNLTFPQHNDFPAVSLKCLNMLLVSLLCSLYLGPPICFIGLTGMRIMTAAIMPMPIASMNEDSNFLSGEYNIRFSGQRLVIHTVAVSHRKQLAAHQKFNTGIFAFDVRHDLATAGRGNRISHYTDKSSGRSEISFSRLPCTKVSNVSTASSEPASLTARISS